MIVLDTNHLRVFAHLGPQRDRLIDQLAQSGQAVGITIVNVQEAIQGWMTEINKTGSERSHVRAYEDLRKLIDAFAEADFILPFDEAAAARSEELKRQFRSMKTKDRRIAAIVLGHDALLLSANLRDFRFVPTLRVEDWVYTIPDQG